MRPSTPIRYSTQRCSKKLVMGIYYPKPKNRTEIYKNSNGFYISTPENQNQTRTENRTPTQYLKYNNILIIVNIYYIKYNL